MSASSIAERAIVGPRLRPRPQPRTLRGTYVDAVSGTEQVIHIRALDEDSPEGASPATPGNSAAANALSTVATYIPSEGIALYIAILALGVAAKVDGWNWVALWAGLGANGLIFSLRFVQVSQKNNVAVDVPRLFYLLIVTGSLTAVYISAIAGNPFEKFSPNSSLISGTLVLVLAFLVPLLAPVIGLDKSGDASTTDQ
jgi:hypothetical protein